MVTNVSLRSLKRMTGELKPFIMHAAVVVRRTCTNIERFCQIISKDQGFDKAKEREFVQLAFTLFDICKEYSANPDAASPSVAFQTHSSPAEDENVDDDFGGDGDSECTMTMNADHPRSQHQHHIQEFSAPVKRPIVIGKVNDIACIVVIIAFEALSCAQIPHHLYQKVLQVTNCFTSTIKRKKPVVYQVLKYRVRDIDLFYTSGNKFYGLLHEMILFKS